MLHLGHLAGYAQHDFQAAQALYQEGLGHLRNSSNAEGTAHALANLGNVAILTGDYATARPLVADSLRMYRELGIVYAQAQALELPPASPQAPASPNARCAWRAPTPHTALRSAYRSRRSTQSEPSA